MASRTVVACSMSTSLPGETASTMPDSTYHAFNRAGVVNISKHTERRARSVAAKSSAGFPHTKTWSRFTAPFWRVTLGPTSLPPPVQRPNGSSGSQAQVDGEAGEGHPPFSGVVGVMRRGVDRSRLLLDHVLAADALGQRAEPRSACRRGAVRGVSAVHERTPFGVRCSVGCIICFRLSLLPC